MSYSVGGHFEPHVDFFNSIHGDQLYPQGDRLSTMIFYLNDVTAGGATVFPHLNISIPPQAGLQKDLKNHKNHPYLQGLPCFGTICMIMVSVIQEHFMQGVLSSRVTRILPISGSFMKDKIKCAMFSVIKKYLMSIELSTPNPRCVSVGSRLSFLLCLVLLIYIY